jgi:exonuclease-1
MDVYGNGDSINLGDISTNTDFNFQNFNQDMILTMCILSGCDYLDSIKGIGFKKAFKLVHEHGDDIGAIIRKIRREGKFVIPPNYE